MDSHHQNGMVNGENGNHLSERTNADSGSDIYCHGHGHRTPFLIGVAGGTASGKTTVCRKIMEKLGQANRGQPRVVVICQDSFYRRFNEKEIKSASVGLFNFDHPDAFDDKLLYRTVVDILAGKLVRIPTYDFKTHTRRDDEPRIIYPADVVIVEGILIYHFPLIRDLFHVKIFVDTDADIRFVQCAHNNTVD